MTAERDALYIADMLGAAEAAVGFSKRTTRSAFLEDQMQNFAVARSLEILGEAAKRVSEEAKAVHPDIPWRRIAGLRDKLIHDYGNVDLHRVWNIIENDLPGLVRQLRSILKEKGVR